MRKVVKMDGVYVDELLELRPAVEARLDALTTMRQIDMMNLLARLGLQAMREEYAIEIADLAREAAP